MGSCKGCDPPDDMNRNFVHEERVGHWRWSVMDRVRDWLVGEISTCMRGFQVCLDNAGASPVICVG